MNEFKKIIIDADNYKYLVRKELVDYVIWLNYGIPRKSVKGYLGCKHKGERIRIKNRDGAEQLFENWKEEFVSKFYRKEIISLYLNYTPVYSYFVTCPFCGKDAEIQDFIMILGTDMEEHYPIVCRHCNGQPEDLYTWSTVGECQMLLLDKTNDEQEITLDLRYNTGNLKYDDFIRNPEVLQRTK
jgi:hypothetical protein